MGNFNLSVLSMGSAADVTGTIGKYASAAALPSSATDGTVAIVLDTNILYSYDTGVAGWVIIGGPGITITATDTNSVDLDLTTNDLEATLRIPPGITGVPAGHHGQTLQIFAGSSPGLVSMAQGFRVGEATSAVLQFSGQSFPVLGGSFLIQVNQASGATSGYLLNTDWTKFNNSIGISSLINTEVPLYGGTYLSPTGGITLSISAASGVTAGYVTITGQTFGGNKTFPGGIRTGDGSAASLIISPLSDPATGLFWEGVQTISFVAGTSSNRPWSVDSGGMNIHNQKYVKFYDTATGEIRLRAANSVTSYDWFWPPAAGATSSVVGTQGASGGMTFFTTDYQKSLLGISNSNFGDVSIGAFLYQGYATGLTISAAQVLQMGWGDTSNPGGVGTTHQVWSGDKDTTGNLGTFSFLRFRGASLVSIGSTAASGYTLILPTAQGATLSGIRNNGLGFLDFSYATPGQHRTVTNAGATLQLIDRFIEITTGATNQTLNVGWATGNTNILFNVLKIDSGVGSVTIQSDRGVNGVTNYTFSSQWESHQFVDNGIGIRVIT